MTPEQAALITEADYNSMTAEEQAAYEIALDKWCDIQEDRLYQEEQDRYYANL
jgi:hypothetical protein